MAADVSVNKIWFSWFSPFFYVCPGDREARPPVIRCKVLFDQLDLTRTPGLLDPGFFRAVHPQDNPPALPGNGLQPVVFLAFGGLGEK